jgi:hypothetical protein
MSLDFGMDTPGISAAALATDVPGKLFAPAIDAMTTSIGVGSLAAISQRCHKGVNEMFSEDVPTPGIEPQGNPGMGGLDSYVTGAAATRDSTQETQKEHEAGKEHKDAYNEHGV